jgi:hypothetical protein
MTDGFGVGGEVGDVVGIGVRGSVAPCGQYMPNVQALQLTCDPVSCHCPAGHGSQFGCPVDAW